MRFLGGALLVITSACGEVTVISAPDAPPPDAPPNAIDGAKSGTRLKLAWSDFGGTRAWAGFYDAQRMERCNISAWSDGHSYCVPSAQGTAFRDVACAQPVGVVYQDTTCTTAPPPTYLIDYSNGACSSQPSHLYQRGAKLAVAQWYERGSDGTCFGPFSSTGIDFYALGTEVSPTDLAMVSLGSPLGEGRLGARAYTSADGLAFPASLHDAVAGIDCAPQSPYEGATQATCVPLDAAYASYYRDATCSAGEVELDRTCKAPQFAVSYADSCPTTRGRYYAVGAANTGSPLYYKSGTTCSATTATPASYRYFGLGNELVLASVNRAPDAAAGRRIVPIHDTWDTFSYPEATLFDSTTGAECTPYTFPDGSEHCIPAGYGTSSYFTNATCTASIQLMSVYTGGATCSPPPLPSYAISYVPDASGKCQSTYEVHPVAAAYTGSVYTLFGSTCYQLSTTYEVFYRVGATLPLSTFASGMRMTDP